MAKSKEHEPGNNEISGGSTESSPEKLSETEDSCKPDILAMIEDAEPGLLEILPPENKEKLRQVLEAQLFARFHRGPLPVPEDIALYDKYIPDGADRIMAMAEREQVARIDRQGKLVSAETKQSGRGQVFGLIIGVLGIASGAVVALLGSEWVGGVISGATVVSLVTVFLTGRKRTSIEAHQKKDG